MTIMVFISRSFILSLSLLKTTTFVSGRALEPRQRGPNFIPRTVTTDFPGCEYPDGWVGCNTDSNRGCWVRDPTGKEYNITTDYETEWPIGKERTYNLTINESTWNGDGTPKNFAQLINGVYPGPLIQACWGDTVIVNVKSELPTNGTAIHFHGVRQLNSNAMDGTSGVTQCPIAGGDSFQYKFKMTQYGHSWYHSHYSTQYSEGAAGAFLVHGPHSSNWDFESAPIVVNDWIHERTYKTFSKVLASPAAMPTADSILFNGVGKTKTTGTFFDYPQKFETGKKYLIRIINASTGLHFNFEIDNHDLTLIATDFVAINESKGNQRVSVGIGQRYTFVVEAKPRTVSSNGRYWMRTRWSSCSGQIKDRVLQWTPGILSYSDSGTGDPTTSASSGSISCDDEPASKLVPVVKWKLNDNNPQNNPLDNTYETGIEDARFHNNATRWSITDTPLWLDWSNPLVFNLGNSSWNPEYGVVSYNYNKVDGLVYLVINSGNLSPPLHKPVKGASPAHPIHLHGHDFAIVGSGKGTYDPTKVPAFNINAPRRDTAMLPGAGWLAIAWKPDNPGAWLLHCHIAWHAGSGMALNILERKDDIKVDLGQAQQGCEKWKSWLADPARPIDRFNPARDQEEGI
ncbi:multicopper oxidase [Dendryphion nanum]|uniref:Multicopper oxidase n=1 Tax=Dendryphion nanum TaxID=256645 RepID=A0A9P9IIW6_9PLEO|nr:multicopper oxidase [Dendryphion nanum]